MEVSYHFEWSKKTLLGLKYIPADIMYAIARQTLDLTISNEYIPWRTGDMMLSSVAGGIGRDGGVDYYIGSYTNYASSVWKMPQYSTNWTNPNSKSRWYAYTLKHHSKTILENAVNKAWRDNML